MNLLTRYFRINLLATVLIFLMASLAFSYLLHYVSLEQVDEDLKIEQREIESFVEKNHRPPDSTSVGDQVITYEISTVQRPYQSFATIQSPNAGEQEDFRQLRFSLLTGDRWLLFKVSKSLEETEKLNRSIITISLVTILVILVVGLLINRWLLRRLWRPFYSSLAAVERYRLGGKNPPAFAQSSIREFDLLNRTLDQFIAAAEKEYRVLKEFTENASHELQTPLAIIRSNLDMMTQEENLSESQSNALQYINGAIQKMTRLNQSLLLLTKIENKQFSDRETFNLQPLVEEKITAWRELWQVRNISFFSSVSPVAVSMNTELADILLNNLFSNASRHCPEGGEIGISLSQKKFEISNTAAGPALDQEKLFQRFFKGGQSTDQNGLGLSIVQQIAFVSDARIRYSFQQRRHVFTVDFV